MSHTQFSQAFLYETERHAAWGGAQLEALMGFLPEGASWTADLPTCRYRQGHVDIRVGVLGTYDAAQRSWMWGWANPELRGTPVAALSEQVGRFGQSRGIAEFTTQVLDLSGFPDPRRAAETLAFAGMGVTGAPGYIGVPANPETQVYFLPEDPQVPRALSTRSRCRARSSRPRACSGSTPGAWSRASSTTTGWRTGTTAGRSPRSCPVPSRPRSASTRRAASPASASPCTEGGATAENRDRRKPRPQKTTPRRAVRCAGAPHGKAPGREAARRGRHTARRRSSAPCAHR